MKEEILQRKIVEIIKSEALLDFIKNQDSLNEAMAKGSDETMLPNFSIDHLLKERYSESARRVLDHLEEYELVSDDSIRNISLDKSERLYPDLILFNPSSCQVIIIENKTSGKTEREAVTELFGYANEIRNHLPFLSGYDINYVLISTEFNTLLDHSVSSNLLGSNINLLCLKPVIEDEEVKCLDVYFPESWTDVGQNDLPADALVGYTMCLYEKEDLKFEEFDVVSKVRMAVDLIRNKASNFNSSGLYLVWKNGHGDFANHCKIGISIYIINPFAFLPEAQRLGFPLNEGSALSEYLGNHIEEFGTATYPSSLFGIASEAEKLLSNYFNVEWDRASNWQLDSSDRRFALQRRVLQWDSWGAVGDYVRYTYLHPASTNIMFSQWDMENGGGYLDPYIGLQIVNHMAGSKIFEYGLFSHKEIFRFAVQVGFYQYACRNALLLESEKEASGEAFLFWNALAITQSLKDIFSRVRDASNIGEPVSFPLAIKKIAIYPDYQERIDGFVNWFKKEFIKSDVNPTMASIFQVTIQSSLYFDIYFKTAIPSKDIAKIEATFAHIVRVKVMEIVLDRRKNPESNIELLGFLNENYFSKRLSELTDGQIEYHMKRISDAELTEGFYDVFLVLLDSIKGGLMHQLNPVRLPESTDWKAFKKSADKMYDAGDRKLAVIISPDGHVGIGRIETPMSLESKDEIFVQFYPNHSMQQMTLRKRWEELISGSFKL